MTQTGKTRPSEDALRFKTVLESWAARQVPALHGKQYLALVKSALLDKEFRRRLLAETAAVLKEFGVEAPEGREIKIVEDTARTVHLVLPPDLEDLDPKTVELLDKQLQSRLAFIQWKDDANVGDWLPYYGSDSGRGADRGDPDTMDP